MGWADTAGYAPAVQEMAALVVTQLPVGEASVVWERLTGVKPPRAKANALQPGAGHWIARPPPRPKRSNNPNWAGIPAR